MSSHSKLFLFRFIQIFSLVFQLFKRESQVIYILVFFVLLLLLDDLANLLLRLIFFPFFVVDFVYDYLLEFTRKAYIDKEIH